MCPHTLGVHSQLQHLNLSYTVCMRPHTAIADVSSHYYMCPHTLGAHSQLQHLNLSFNNATWVGLAAVGHALAHWGAGWALNLLVKPGNASLLTVKLTDCQSIIDKATLLSINF